MPRYTEEQITRANETDLVSFLRVRGEKLKKSGKEYRWMKHDSLTVDHNEWYRFSGSKGGHPIDFLMEFYNMSFPEAFIKKIFHLFRHIYTIHFQVFCYFFRIIASVDTLIFLIVIHKDIF